jgi:mutator protein MutT
MSDAALPIAAAVVLQGGRVLVQTRAPGRSWSGHWEFPGGKLEPGEDAAAAAVRECREELGLDVAVLGPLHEVEWSYPGARVRVSFLLCEPLAGARPRAAEGQELRWADADELQRLEFLPANAGVLALLVERLRGAARGGPATAS